MRNYFLLLVAGLVLFPVSAFGQAWTQDKGSAYLKVAHGRTAVSDQYDLNGDVIPFLPMVDGDAFFDRSVYLYSEFGVHDHVTLVAMIPIKNIAVMDATSERQRTVGIADVELRGRIDLRSLVGGRESPNAAALSIGARLPTGYTRNLSPSVGAGQVDLQVGLSLGRSFHPVPVYAQFGGGFLNRLSAFGFSRTLDCTTSTDVACVEPLKPDFDNEWFYSGEAGVSVGSRVLLQLLMQGVRSVNAPDELFDVNNPIPTRRRFLKLGGGITVSAARNIGVSFQTFRTTAGRNTIRSTEYFFGVEYRVLWR